jgi:hypothetical protein
MGRKESDLLSEAAIDREIQKALAVDPSPEFLARVRTRIAKAPPLRRFPSIWMAAFALGVVVLVVSLGRPKEVAFETPNVGAGPMKSDVVLSPPVEPATGAAQTVPPNLKHARPPTRHELDQVLISSRDRIAFERFITNVRAGKFILSFEDPPTVIDAQVLTDIAIPPIRIDPIVPLTPAEGVHQ